MYFYINFANSPCFIFLGPDPYPRRELDLQRRAEAQHHHRGVTRGTGQNTQLNPIRPGGGDL